MQCVLLSRSYQIKKIDKKLKPLPPILLIFLLILSKTWS